jgi:hypothetical protein
MLWSATSIHEQHEPSKLAPLTKITVYQERNPFGFCARHFRVSVAGHVDQGQLLSDDEKVQ